MPHAPLSLSTIKRTATTTAGTGIADTLSCAGYALVAVGGPEDIREGERALVEKRSPKGSVGSAASAAAAVNVGVWQAGIA